MRVSLVQGHQSGPEAGPKPCPETCPSSEFPPSTTGRPCCWDRMEGVRARRGAGSLGQWRQGAQPRQGRGWGEPPGAGV